MQRVRNLKAISPVLQQDSKRPIPVSRIPSAPPSQSLGIGRIAFVHDWCPTFRGGERVLARLCTLFPKSDVYTLFDFLDPKIKEQYFPDTVFHTSAANRLPMIEKFY